MALITVTDSNLTESDVVRQACERFIRLHPELGKFALDEFDLEQLINIHQILSIPHRAQELLSAEKTPTLSHVLPVFEALVQKFKELEDVFPELQHAIKEGTRKIEEYANKSRKNNVYALAMGEFRPMRTRPIPSDFPHMHCSHQSDFEDRLDGETLDFRRGCICREDRQGSSE